MRIIRKLASILLAATSAFGIVDNGMDIDICSASPDSVLDYESNYAGFWNPDNEYEALFVFDIKRSDSPAEITFTLFRQEPGRVFSVYEIVENWDSDVTWNTQPDNGLFINTFITAVSIKYTVDAPRIKEYGWMVKNDLGKTPPCEI
jgi:hypothetical protein